MRLIMRLLLIWGICDGLWLAASPAGWERFWERGVSFLSKGSKLPRLFAVLQLWMCIWMLFQTRRRRPSRERF